MASTTAPGSSSSASLTDPSARRHGRRRPRSASWSSPGGRSTASIVDHLRGRRLLLVLDNCEHLLAACAELAHTILVACPDVRDPGDQPGAAGHRRRGAPARAPLTVPDRRPGCSARRTSLACDAVQLFLERAQGRRPRLRARRPQRRGRSSRSAAGSTASRWPSSWPPRACARSRSSRSRPGSTIASGS